MAKLVYLDCYLVVNGVNLSNRASSVEIQSQQEDVDLTAFGADGKQRGMGLKDEQVTVTYKQDFAAANVDATNWPLYQNRTAFTIEVRPTSGAVSATNPKWTGTAYLAEYTPIAGSIGEGAEAEVTYLIDGVLTRATA